MKNVEELTMLDKQIILYAKGWYGKKENIINDLKQIISKVCAIDVEHIPNRDVYGLLVSAYVKVGTDNYHTAVESITEMIGEKWPGSLSYMNRKPEEIMIGILSICDGDYARNETPLFKFPLTSST